MRTCRAWGGSAEACGVHQAWLRALGRGGRGQLLLEERDEERFLEFSRSKDGQVVAINASTKTSSEVGQPIASPRHRLNWAHSASVWRQGLL